MFVALSREGSTERLVGHDGVTASETRFPSSLRIEQHEHDTAYLCVVLDGVFAETADARYTDATPGMVYYVPLGLPHANTFGPAGARCLLLELDRSAAHRLREAGADPETPWVTAGGVRAWLGLHLYGELKHRAASTLTVEEFLLQVFCSTARAAVRDTRPPVWLRQVREALDAQVRRPPSIAALASEAAVHPMHLLRAFRTYYGSSPGEYVQTRRVAEACRLLLEGPDPLAQLALRLGFYDQSHFTRAFKARIGLPPGAYRSCLSAAPNRRSRS